MASIACWEGSQTGNFCRLPAAQTADNLRHDVIQLISGGGGCNAGGPGETADKGGLFHSVPIVEGTKLVTAAEQFLKLPATIRHSWT